MKKSILAISILIIAGQAKAQVVELFKGFNMSAIQPGDSFAVEIKNTGMEPFTFYPLTVLDSSGNYLFLSEENYFSYLRSAGNQIDALRAHARIVKSPFFVVGQTPVSELNNGSFQQDIAEKKYSFPQWFLTSCHYECGEYTSMGNLLLTRSLLFEKDSLWDLNLSGHHTLSEGIVNGDTLLIDFDPNMPRFLDTLPNSTYMGASDAYQHPEYFNFQSPFKICDENDSCWVTDEKSDSAYAAFFQDIGNIDRYPIKEIEPQNMPGTWTLCAGCSFVFEWRVPEYVLDINDTQTMMLIDSVSMILGSQQIDTAVLGYLTQRLFGTSSGSEGIDVLNNNNIIFVHELADLDNSTAFHYTNTTIKLKIPGSPTGYGVGDIQLPLAVNKITSENGLTIGSNSINPGSHEFKLWTEGILGKRDLTISSDSFNHLRDVNISENNPVEIELYYNQLLYRFLHGIKAEVFSATPSLTVTTYPGITPVHETKTNNTIIFPNPAQNKLWVSHPGILSDISGASILALKQGINDIGVLASGIYFFSCNNETKRIIKY